MGKYGDRAEQLFCEGYNCAQSVFAAFCDVTGMEFETALRLASPFGGGIGRMREVCGALSGALMVMGLCDGYSELGDDARKAEVYARTQEFAKGFEAEFGSILCRDLLELPVHREAPVPEARTAAYYEARPCAEFVRKAAERMAGYLEVLG